VLGSGSQRRSSKREGSDRGGQWQPWHSPRVKARARASGTEEDLVAWCRVRPKGRFGGKARLDRSVERRLRDGRESGVSKREQKRR
jgi:hypothetical protein